MVMDARAVWQGGFETRLDDGRGHSVTVDEPVEDGGADAGTSSLELMVLSLSGCMSTIFHIIARKRKIPFEAVTISLHAERPRGAATITNVRGTFEVRTGAPKEDVATAVRLTVKTCPVGVLLDRALVPVDVEVVILPPVSMKGPTLPEPNAPQPA